MLFKVVLMVVVSFEHRQKSSDYREWFIPVEIQKASWIGRYNLSASVTCKSVTQWLGYLALMQRKGSRFQFVVKEKELVFIDVRIITASDLWDRCCG